MESACCFIGHRNIERASEVQEKLRKELRKLIEQGTTRFIFGDHSEFNTLCYDTVTELMQEYPQIKRVKFRKDYPEITESVKQLLKRTMTVPTMAKLLGIKEANAYELIHRLHFRSVKTEYSSQRLLIDKATFNEWLKKQTHYKIVEGKEDFYDRAELSEAQ